MDAGTLLAAVFAPVEQDYLLEARQMQALSFAIHIPLVCFGIAFPAMVLFVEWLYLRTGDPLYRTLARRWSKVMLALFAAGVVTGTILSFEMGLLWPGFMARFGDVFGLGFALEGFSFFVEAIFIAIYVYGWDRLSPRMHFLSGIPVVVAGFTGSLTVISVNAWMNHPRGFALRGGQVVDVDPWRRAVRQPAPVARAHAHVPRRLHRRRVPRRRRLRLALAARRAQPVRAYRARRSRSRSRRWPRRCRSSSATGSHGGWPRTSRSSSPRFEGLGETTDGRSRARRRLVRRTARSAGASRSPGCCRCSPATTRTRRCRASTSVPADDRPPVNVVRVAFQTMVAIGFALAGARASGTLIAWWRRRRLPSTPWFFRAVVAAAPLSVVALIAGWVTTEVGRQPWVVYGVMRTEEAVTGAGGHPRRIRDPRRRLRRPDRRRRVDPAPAGARPARDRRRARPGGARARWLSFRSLFALAGLAAYIVLAGADFGAGIWHMLPAGPARRRGARAHSPLDVGGVGGQPRLADLRARRVLDRLPGRVRVDRVDARRAAAASRRSGSSCAASPTRCAAPQRPGARSCWSAACSRSPRCSPRSRSAPRSAGSRPAGCRSATPPATCGRAG